MANKLSFGQKLSIFIGVVTVALIGAVALIFVLVKDGDSGEGMSHFFRDLVAARYETDQLKEAEEMIKRNPKSGEGYAKRADYYYRKYTDDDRAKALKDYDTAISLEPKRAEWYHARGEVWGYYDGSEKAIADMSKAIELKPDKEYYFDRGDVYETSEENDKALADFEEALKLGYPGAAVHVHLGAVYVQKKDMDKAISEYKKCLETVSTDQDPEESKWRTDRNYDQAFDGLAKIYIARADFRATMKVLDQWVQLHPDEEDAYVFRARVNRALERKDKERDDLNSLVRVYSEEIKNYPSERDYRLRGHTYKAIGKTAEANADFKRAIEMYEKEESSRFGDAASDSKTDEMADYDRSQVIEMKELLGEKLAPEETRRNIEEATKKIAKDPKNAKLYSDRAWRYEESKQFDLALRDYEQARKMNPDENLSETKIMHIFVKQKKYDEAMSMLKKLVGGSESENSYLFVTMAEIYELTGHHDEAIESANRAIELDPFCSGGFYWRSKAYASKGDEERAKTNMQQAIAFAYSAEDYE